MGHKHGYCISDQVDQEKSKSAERLGITGTKGHIQNGTAGVQNQKHVSLQAKQKL